MRFKGWIVLYFCCIFSSFAQSSTEKTYLYNGMQVVWMPDATNADVDVCFFVKNQPIIEQKVGMAQMVSSLLLQQKTVKGIPDIVDYQKDKGILISGNGQFLMASFKQERCDDAMNLFYQMVTKPTFSEPGLDILRQEFMMPLNREDSAELLSKELFNKFSFGFQHPSSNFMQQSDVFKIKIADLMSYHQNAYTPKNVILVVSGRYDKTTLKKTIEQTFGKWKATEATIPIVKTNKPPVPNQVFLVNRLETKRTIITMGYSLDVNPSMEDVRRCYLLAEIIQRVFTNNGFEQVHVELHPERYTGNFQLSFQTSHEQTKTRLDEANTILKDIYLGRINEAAFDAVKKDILVKWGTATPEQRLENNLLLFGNGNIEIEATEVSNWKEIGIEQLKVASFKYLKPTNLNIIAIGDIDTYYNTLQSLGNVQVVNEQGMSAKYTPKEKKWSLNPYIQNYLKACNAQLLQQHKNVRMVYQGEFLGKPVFLEQFQEKDFTFFSLSTADIHIKKQSTDGKFVFLSEFGRSVQIDSVNAKEALIFSQIYPESVFEQWKINIASKEIMVENIPAVELSIKLPSGKTILSYFSKETGLKIKTLFSKIINGDVTSQEIFYDNYQQTIIGKLPTTIIINEKGMSLKLDLQKVEADINKGDYDFSIDK